MPHVVIGNVIFFEEVLLEEGREVIVSGAAVGEGSTTACTRGRKLVGEEEGVASAARIEGGITMKQSICLDVVHVF